MVVERMGVDRSRHVLFGCVVWWCLMLTDDCLEYLPGLGVSARNQEPSRLSPKPKEQQHKTLRRIFGFSLKHVFCVPCVCLLGCFFCLLVCFWLFACFCLFVCCYLLLFLILFVFVCMLLFVIFGVCLCFFVFVYLSLCLSLSLSTN